MDTHTHNKQDKRKSYAMMGVFLFLMVGSIFMIESQGLNILFFIGLGMFIIAIISLVINLMWNTAKSIDDAFGGAFDGR